MSRRVIGKAAVELQKRLRRETPPADLTSNSDIDLLHLLRKGNNEAMTVLFKRHKRVVERFALKILGDQSEAEDVTQEVFAYVFKKTASFIPYSTRSSVRSILLLNAYDRSLDRIRYLKARKFDRTVRISENHTGKTIQNLGEGIVRYSPLKKAMLTLNEFQRKIIELHHLRDISIADIAAITGKTELAIRSELFRARKNLKSAINNL